MARAGSRGALLYWSMLLVGGAALFASAYVPAWLETQALQQAYTDALRRIAVLEERLTRVNKQIEHLQNDPAYLERLARKELREQTRGIEWVEIPQATSVDNATPPATACDIGSEKAGTAPQPVTRTNPLIAVFAFKESRPALMAMSGVLVFVAIVLLLNRNRS